MQLGLQYFPWYSSIASSTYPLHFNTIMVGVGKVRNICAHVDIIELNLIKLLWSVINKENTQACKDKIIIDV